MSIYGLLNQTATIYSRTSYNAEGREVVGAGTIVRCRFQAKRVTRLTTVNTQFPTIGTLAIDATVYVPLDTAIEIDDRIDYGGDKYKVSSKYPVTDGIGSTHHIKLEVVKWREI